MAPSEDRGAALALARLLAAPGAGDGGVPDAAWPALAAAARARGLAPLLYRRFAAAVPRRPAARSALAPLRASYLHTLGANLRAAEQLAGLLAALEKSGVRAVLLKGAHLAFAVCADPGERPMGDLDLLVAPAQVEAAAAALRATGLHPLQPYALEAQFAHMAHLPPFAAPGRLPVELHWRLVRPQEPFRVDVPALLDRARPLPALGPRALTLDPADAFLHLALHAIVKDRLAGGLRFLIDCALLFASAPDDPSWRAAAARARAAGAGRVHDLALALLDTLSPEALPPPGLATAGEPPEPWVLESARALLLDPPGDGRAAVQPNLARAFAGPARESARLVLARLFPPRSELDALEGAPAAGALRPLRYPLRWAALLSRHGATAWRLLRRGAAERARAARSERGRAVAAWCGEVRP